MLGADPNATLRGKTALGLAAAKGNVDIAIELLRGGISGIAPLSCPRFRMTTVCGVRVHSACFFSFVL